MTFLPSSTACRHPYFCSFILFKPVRLSLLALPSADQSRRGLSVPRPSLSRDSLAQHDQLPVRLLRRRWRWASLPSRHPILDLERILRTTSTPTSPSPEKVIVLPFDSRRPPPGERDSRAPLAHHGTTAGSGQDPGALSRSRLLRDAGCPRRRRLGHPLGVRSLWHSRSRILWLTVSPG